MNNFWRSGYIIMEHNKPIFI